MRRLIIDFPKQFKKGLELAKDVKIKGDFNSVVFSGMGGSAWPAEILKDWLNPLFHFYVNRSYNLPPQASKNTFCVFCSYSGNTEECLSAYKQVIEKKLPACAITSGGKLKELCRKNNTPCINIPKVKAGKWPVPRLATGYFFAASCQILENADIITNKSKLIAKSSDLLDSGEFEKKGKELAKKLKNKIPVIYSSHNLKSLSYVWKIKLNENAKTPAFGHCFSEMNHNEMEGFQNKQLNSNFYAIMLNACPEGVRRNGLDAKIQKRMKLTQEVLKKNKIDSEIIKISKENLFEKIFSFILLADWTSYYLAKEYKVDPFDIKMIEGFKKKMRK